MMGPKVTGLDSNIFYPAVGFAVEVPACLGSPTKLTAIPVNEIPEPSVVWCFWGAGLLSDH